MLYGDYGNPFGQGAAANSGESVWVWCLVAGGWLGDALMVFVWTLDEAKDFVQKIEDGKKKKKRRSERDRRHDDVVCSCFSIHLSISNQSIHPKKAICTVGSWISCQSV